MTARTDPSALRWLIGVELARYRNACGMSLSAVSAQTGISKPKLGHLETGRQHQDPDEIALLLRTYGAEQRDVDRLTSLTGRADEATWWAPWAHVVPDWLRTFVGIESLAELEFIYEPILIPGLLQTEDYARAVTKAARRVRADHAERFVAFRLARARRLTDDEPLRLHAVIGEAALRLDLGDPAIMREQYRHLVELAERPNVTVQVLRPEDGIHSAVTGGFVVLNFADVRSIAYVEMQDGAVYVQDPDEVRTYSMSAENLWDVALDPDKSLSLIQAMIEN